MRWLLAVILVAACGPGAATAPPLADLPETAVEVDGEELRLAWAASREARARGLADVADLGDLDGLVLAFDEPVTTSLTSLGVRIPLDIAWIAEDGRVIDRFRMAPCPADPCPTFGTLNPYRWAIEAPAGRLDGLERGDVVEISPP